MVQFFNFIDTFHRITRGFTCFSSKITWFFVGSIDCAISASGLVAAIISVFVTSLLTILNNANLKQHFFQIINNLLDSIMSISKLCIGMAVSDNVFRNMKLISILW